MQEPSNQNIFGYVGVLDLDHPVPITMEQVQNNPPHFIGLIVKNHGPNRPKLNNLNDFLINGQLPENLLDLDCDNNNISVLPELPNSLELLSCNENNIESLPNLPNSLQYLFYDENKITALPNELPNQLSALTCNDNIIQNLPPLNQLINLMNLECSYNNLSEIPNFYLPSAEDNSGGLETLNCSYNKIIGLPILPRNLIDFNCSNNQIFSLPELPLKLIKLNFSSNLIIGSIENINFPATLKKLNLSDCQITSLPKVLPLKLKELDCSNNQIVSLPKVLPNNLKKFNCSNNKITYLPDLPKSLRVLFCKENKFNEESINKIIAFYELARYLFIFV
uniref:Uncharacterized protein n=1 Tax=viral metagenome TaxID=1070528 RepID=A0A6C0KRA0_9ZZZZ